MEHISAKGALQVNLFNSILLYDYCCSNFRTHHLREAKLTDPLMAGDTLIPREVHTITQTALVFFTKHSLLSILHFAECTSECINKSAMLVFQVRQALNKFRRRHKVVIEHNSSWWEVSMLRVKDSYESCSTLCT